MGPDSQSDRWPEWADTSTRRRVDTVRVRAGGWRVAAGVSGGIQNGGISNSSGTDAAREAAEGVVAAPGGSGLEASSELMWTSGSG